MSFGLEPQETNVCNYMYREREGDIQIADDSSIPRDPQRSAGLPQ